MTNAEAKKILIANRMIGTFALANAIDVAVKALEQEPMIDMEIPRCCIGCPILRESEGYGAYCPFVCEENNINIKQRTDRPSECPLKEAETK